MTSPSGFSSAPSKMGQEQTAGITSVDLINLTAQGYTRQQTTVPIDLRYYVGAVHVIPAVGDQWLIRRYGTSWILVTQLPYNATEIAAVKDTMATGMVQIGNTNPQGSGPLELNGSQVNINANFRLGTTLYRDNNGTLEYQIAGSSSWIAVAEGGGGVVIDWDDITDKPTTFPTDWDDVADKPTSFPVEWTDVADKPLLFPPVPPTGTPDGTKFWRDDNTWAVPPGSGGGGSTAGINIITGEVPTGSINGSNVVFTLANAYDSGTTMVYLNGMRLELGNDYTESSSTAITFASAPHTGDDLRVDYVIPGLILSFTAGESPSGTQDGTNVTFTLTHNYLASTTSVFRNGLREQLGVGYLEAGGNTLTFTTAPRSDDLITVDYLALT